MGKLRYRESTKFLARAEKSIPLGSQTFSKSRTQYPVGASPLFIDRGHGTHVWDIDGNRYIDLVNGLAAVTIGYSHKKIDDAVRKQMTKGTIFSLPGKLEAEVAELVIQTVPSAEMVRFGKNGSDATTAAIRLARAYTQRDHIAFCGYHSWQDWYIGATNMNKGVPSEVSKLTHEFKYNDVKSLESIFISLPNKIAAVILEPMSGEFPKDNFLQKVKKLAEENGSVLIFDEVVTGYRFTLGGAQSEFNVTPDLTTLGKGIANGYPLSVLAGRASIMKELANVFFSGTFGGELLSLAAAKTVINMHLESNIPKKISKVGLNMSQAIEEIIKSHELNDILHISGHPTWKFLNWTGTSEYSSSMLKTYFMQEMFKRGILVLSTHNNSLSLTHEIAVEVVDAYQEVLSLLKKDLENSYVVKRLKVNPILPLFSVR
jgi:glutamate-1-semialdehyde 2,1-aminomutase